MSFTQDNRNLKITTPLGKDVLLAVGFNATEGLNRPFHFRVDLLSEADSVDFDALMEKGVTVSLRTASGERYFHGIVRSFQQNETNLEFASYQAEVVPWFWLLTRTHDCRIFQNKSVPQIITQIFDDLGFSDYELRLEGAYDPKVYCVQYRESDFDFVSRLMEQEGIHYFFAHEDGRHVMVLGDGPAANHPLPGKSSFRFNRDRRSIQGDDVVHSLSQERSIQSAKVRLDDYNFETPNADISAERAGEEGNAQWEVYDYPGRYDDSGGGSRYARIRMEEHSSQIDYVSGRSFCRDFVPGYRFQLTEHPRGELNRAFLIVELGTSATELGGYQPGASGATDFSYQNEFRSIPYGITHRPARATRRPFVRGTQTAVVVGPAGEEIYTDKYGRVKVQFHWDREGKNDENSSCWIRVSQGWAGKNWGIVFLPRIGQEVVVDFLEGDPDRPIITGRVYHAESMPALDLPGEMTRSTIKSRSTKGGSPANFNEIRFEDKKDEEEVYVHAEKDHNQITENDRSEDVGRDRSLKVGRDKSEEVGNDKTVLVKHDLTEEVQNNETLKVVVDRVRNVDQNESVTIGQDRIHKVGQNESIEVGQDLTRKVGSNETIEVGADRKLEVTGDQETKVTGDRKVDVTGDQETKAKKIVLEADQEIELKTGASTFKMDMTGKISLQGTTIEITGATTVQVKGGTILLN